MGKASTRAQNKYIAKAYDRINLTVPKGKKETIQAHAVARGESVNGFINRAIDEVMERDSLKGPTVPAERAFHSLRPWSLKVRPLWISEKEVNDMTDKERKDTKMATIYELRLLFTSGEKKEYTVEEIAELLDKIAAAKDQE